MILWIDIAVCQC